MARINSNGCGLGWTFQEIEGVSIQNEIDRVIASAELMEKIGQSAIADEIISGGASTHLDVADDDDLFVWCHERLRAKRIYKSFFFIYYIVTKLRDMALRFRIPQKSQ